MRRWLLPLVLAAGCGRLNFDSVATSCRELLDAGAPSGEYTLETSAGRFAEVFCDMTTLGGGWARVVDFTATGAECPGEWRPNADPAVCRVADPSPLGARRSAFFASPIGPYQEVMGYVRAYQFWSTDSFNATSVALDDNYVDGVSLTYGAAGARRHIWTYASGWSNTDFLEPINHCPCDAGGRPPPAEVGSDYYCASGDNSTPRLIDTWYIDDPLWDGRSPGPGCDTNGDPSRFQRAFPTAVADPIEVRLMVNQEGSTEDIGLYRLELYVR